MKLFGSFGKDRNAQPPSRADTKRDGMSGWWRSADIASGSPGAAGLSVRFMELHSFLDGKVAIGENGALVHHALNARIQTPEAVAIVLPDHPELLFLTATFGPAGTISSFDDPNGGPVISYAIDCRKDGAFALRSPLNGRYVSAGPFGDQPARLVCNREAPQAWEMFRLAPHTGRLERAWEEALAAALRAIPADPADPEQIVEWLRDTDLSSLALVGEALLRCLPMPLVGVVIDRLIALGIADRVIRTALRADPWFEAGWRALADWMTDRPRRARHVVDATLDFIVGENPAAMSFCRLATLRARSSIGPRSDLAVLATVWNDGPYILQWVAHHRALGATGIFLYSVDGDDRSEMLLDALAEQRAITWIRCSSREGISRHRKAYNHYMSCLPDGLDHQWSAILDIDEYVVLDTDRYRSLPDFLTTRADAGATAIALSRQLFVVPTDDGSISRPLTERATGRFDRHNREIKSIFRTANFHSSHAHDPAPTPGVDWTFHNAVGSPHHWPGRLFNPALGEPIFENAWINSYRIKSIDETIWETNKPFLNGSAARQLGLPPERLLGHLQDRAQDSLTEDRSALAHQPETRRELVELRALPGVSEAEERMLAIYSDKVTDLKAILRARMQRDPILRGIAGDVLPRRDRPGPTNGPRGEAAC